MNNFFSSAKGSLRKHHIWEDRKHSNFSSWTTSFCLQMVHKETTASEKTEEIIITFLEQLLLVHKMFIKKLPHFRREINITNILFLKKLLWSSLLSIVVVYLWTFCGREEVVEENRIGFCIFYVNAGIYHTITYSARRIGLDSARRIRLCANYQIGLIQC